MIIKGIVEEDFSNYKKPSMLIATARCNMKCNVLNGCNICQNNPLLYKPDIQVSNQRLINIYLNNGLTEAIVFGGLDPCDQFAELISFISDFRQVSNDPIIIYTGYTKEELQLTGQLNMLKVYGGIIVKFGRYMMGCEPHYDELLGVKLASPNQYAERIS